MDGFSYVNIFDTKGIEYIIIIAFLLLIIPFWQLLNRPLNAHSTQRQKATRPLLSSRISTPQGIYLSNNHTWAHMLKSGEARIGLGSLLLNLTGGVELKMIREPGTSVRKGEAIAEIFRDGRRLTIASPVSGTITGLNREVLEDPSMLLDDPYGTGWLCSIEPANWLKEITSFHFAAEASEWIGMELARIRDFMAISAGRLNTERHAVYMQDGGELADYPLALMPEEVWNDFQREFLN